MIERTRTDLSGMSCSASFSDCEAYRYLLTWRWSDAPLLVAWMLNPSTATHEVLDPTISGLVKRARAWGRGGVRIVNLFAYRATDPMDMKRAADPVGQHNDYVTRQVLDSEALLGGQVICGWGAHGGHMGRAEAAIKLAQRAEVRLVCFDVNKDGSPKHPLYVPHAITPRSWVPGEATP